MIRPTRDSYGPVIGLLIVTYAMATLAGSRWTISALLLVQIGTAAAALRASHAHPKVRLSAILIFSFALVAGVANLIADRRVLLGMAFLAGTALYLVAPVAILHDLADRRSVDPGLMLGALAAYLMLGMAFGFAYRCVAAFQPAPFFGKAGDGTLADALFFSFVTLTTTGYGNVVPAGNPGQSLAVLEALIGQLFLVTAVAKIVNVWQPRAWRDRETDA